jgi:beta-1,4-mannosyl-glycoprotein beta-1,4-N-acetylglucosaminyltransferase
MKIFDCFMYFDEDLILDLRLNYLDKFVDHFVVVESVYNHNGQRREPQFNIDKFKKFKNKIKYLLIDHEGEIFSDIKKNDNIDQVATKQIMNALKRENYQRNYIINGLTEARDDDWIIISDLDEIPNLEVNDLKSNKSEIIFFKQLMIYYKLNLYLRNFPWIGSKACKKKRLKSAQWLRNIKDRSYAWWRIDTLFSTTKYSNIKIFDNGGWHFSYIKSPKNIEKKLKSYLHHTEYELNPLGSEKILELIKQKKTVYNLNVDSRSNKFSEGNTLEKLSINYLPKYVKDNLIKFNDWIEK